MVPEGSPHCEQPGKRLRRPASSLRAACQSGYAAVIEGSIYG